MRFTLLFSLLILTSLISSAEDFHDTIPGKTGDTLINKRIYQKYKVNSNLEYLYSRPHSFEFIGTVPVDMWTFCKMTVKKENIFPVAGMLASTVLMVYADQKITNATQQASDYIGIDRTRKFKSGIGFKVGGMQVDMLDIPDNFNSTVYFMGEGWPTIITATGMLTYGLVKKDYRALRTASMIAESYIAMGFTVQFFKRITGRESPFVATQDGGVWKPFPNPGKYQSNVPHYDAFPSGHAATVMATITILDGAYPEYCWIKPVGYSALGLICLAMVNNGVHWISDYPLAIAIGYAYGKIALARNRIMENKKNHETGFIKSTMIGPTYYGNHAYGLSLRLGI